MTFYGTFALEGLHATPTRKLPSRWDIILERAIRAISYNGHTDVSDIAIRHGI